MDEPPAKRAKRTDSSAMWDKDDQSPRALERHTPRKASKDPASRSDRRDDRPKVNGRDERRHRSRSRERIGKRRERSRSRDRDVGRYRNGDRGRDVGERRERDKDRDRDRDRNGDRHRDRDRSTSRDRQRSRRGKLISILSMTRRLSDFNSDAPKPRADRPKTRSRSRSPVRNGRSHRTRSPPPKPVAATNSKTPASSTASTKKAPPTSPKISDPMSLDPPTTTKARSTTPTNAGLSVPTSKKVTKEDDSDPEVAEMRALMGFAGFRSTKNTKVPGNDVYAVRKEKKTEYRQYMNRVGGFNRPLSPSR